jgi:hypothetical protein
MKATHTYSSCHWLMATADMVGSTRLEKIYSTSDEINPTSDEIINSKHITRLTRTLNMVPALSAKFFCFSINACNTSAHITARIPARLAAHITILLHTLKIEITFKHIRQQSIILLFIDHLLG